MEAVREASSSLPADYNNRISEEDSSLSNELPPPPEPFPTCFLHVASNSSKEEQKVIFNLITIGRTHITRSSGTMRNADFFKNVARSISAVQKSCIQALSTLLPSSKSTPCASSSEQAQCFTSDQDNELAGALMELLEVTYELEGFVSPISDPVIEQVDSSIAREEQPVHVESLKTLTAQLEMLQLACLKNAPLSPTSANPDVIVTGVRQGMVWARIESLSRTVMEFAKRREPKAQKTKESLPPSYEIHDNMTSPPRYSEHDSTTNAYSSTEEKDQPVMSEKKPQYSHDAIERQPTAQQEKMFNELEVVTAAIERLYSVAPQLQNQRVELRSRVQREDLSTSRHLSGSIQKDEYQVEGEEGKLEQIKLQELNCIYQMLQKSKNGIMHDQRVDLEDLENRSKEKFIRRVIEQSEASRLIGQDSKMGNVDADLAMARDSQDRDQFLKSLMDQTAGGRMNNQDADAPPEDLAASRQAKQQALISTIVAHIRMTRLASQDFPSTIEDRLSDKATAFMEQLVDYSSSGRLHGQDSMPPSRKKTDTIGGGEEGDLHEVVSVTDFLQTRPPLRTEGKGSKAFMRKRSNSEGKKNKVSLKIAEMVQRRSVHSGFKSPFSSGVDVTTMSYIAEHQEQLRSVQIMLHGADISPDLDFMVKTPESDSGLVDNAIITSKREPSISLSISMPIPVYSDQSTLMVHQVSHFEAKLSAFPTSSRAIQLVTTQALSASELRTLAPSKIVCTNCERELASLPSPTSSNLAQAYKNLPSSHWAEMIDVWMCHDDPQFTSRLANLVEQGFWPQDGVVLVGGSWLLTESERGKWENLRREGTPKDGSWDIITCACGTLVGRQRTRDGKPGAGTLRFFKYAVGLSDNDEQDIVEHVTRYPLSVFIVSDILELAQAHASYRFIISDEETGHHRIYLWLFNSSLSISFHKPSVSFPLSSPLRATFAQTSIFSEKKSIKSKHSSVSSSVSTNRSKNREEPKEKVIKAIKVMYKIANDGVDMEALPGFGPGGQVEHLSYSRDVCHRLHALLSESNAVYPPARRTMGAFEVGFLERA
nr:hypothetical protein L203_05186 [Cryptococcus depauperatus CBS 7841]